MWVWGMWASASLCRLPVLHCTDTQVSEMKPGSTTTPQPEYTESSLPGLTDYWYLIAPPTCGEATSTPDAVRTES